MTTKNSDPATPNDREEEERKPFNQESQDHSNAEIVLYSRRWWYLLAVILLNFANYGHWVAFASVTKMSAKYYDQQGDKVDLITLLSYIVGIPFCVFATYAIETYGLKLGMRIGAILTLIGKHCQQG